MPAYNTTNNAFVEQITQDTEKLKNLLVTPDVEIGLVVHVVVVGEILFI